jgi:hypothetical protein
MNIDNRLWGMRCKHLIYLNITNHTKKNIERILVHFQVKPKGYGKDCRQGFKLIFCYAVAELREYGGGEASFSKGVRAIGGHLTSIGKMVFIHRPCLNLNLYLHLWRYSGHQSLVTVAPWN